MAHEFNVIFLVEDDELESSIEAYMAEPEAKVPVSPNPEHALKIAAIARDLQLSAYEDGSMHGHFKVLGYRQNIDPAYWMRQHFPVDPKALVEEALSMISAGTYTSSYEGQIIDKLKKALEAL